MTVARPPLGNFDSLRPRITGLQKRGQSSKQKPCHGNGLGTVQRDRRHGGATF